ncbi:hypothetical protein SAMN04487906_3191 [Zhouia amylolytica]|uniref:Uncharacterized protein n=2 Tax=Zhouia amylolytica TaxID=376730 RepID=W2US46_9FLAO|nr:hypothetical protein [Zhouia amylolytica]ETN96162.1 hypothetical protein P278_09280 [Zhouia amylolytica AD3]SFT14325.1 hypothetical protein SAMN04487906_3191 [Zhouia amylolytica]
MGQIVHQNAVLNGFLKIIVFLLLAVLGMVVITTILGILGIVH